MNNIQHLLEIAKQMTDVQFLELVRGSLFKISLLIFLFGIAYQIIKILILGVPKNKAKPKGSPTFSALKMLFMKPFNVLSYRDVLSKRTITYVAGFTFHVCFILLIFFIPQHSFVWDNLLGIKLPYFSAIVSNFLAYGALVSIIALWINRLSSPVLRLISGKDEYIGNFLITTALLTGIIATRWVGSGDYSIMLALHILTAEILIIYIPFSRLSHFITYFVSLAFYGRSVGISGARE